MVGVLGDVLLAVVRLEALRAQPFEVGRAADEPLTRRTRGRDGPRVRREIVPGHRRARGTLGCMCRICDGLLLAAGKRTVSRARREQEARVACRRTFALAASSVSASSMRAETPNPSAFSKDVTHALTRDAAALNTPRPVATARASCAFSVAMRLAAMRRRLIAEATLPAESTVTTTCSETGKASLYCTGPLKALAAGTPVSCCHQGAWWQSRC